MSIIIKGMEMPTKGNPLTVLIYPDGTATWKDREYEAIELPPHGDLIDLQAMLDESENGKYVWVYDLTDLPEFTKDLPVVVPAEKGE